MTHYRSNLRDIEFNLFEVFGSSDSMGKGPFTEMDVDTAREVLKEVDRLASGPLAEPFAENDRVPPVFDPATYSVTMPDSFTKAFNILKDSEWWRLDLPEHLGGTGAPPTLRWAAAELFVGANPAAYMFMNGPNMAAVIDHYGNDEQKRWAQLMIDRGWGSTMVLTEPDAGSDVGAGRTKAIDNGDGTWRIEGVKRFITNGDQDMTENIMHLVLARPEGAVAGTKGLSLFLVPKFMFDPTTGAPTTRNGVNATNVEKKMGLKVSTTCELTFGEKEPAIGWLLGDAHNGIAQMFSVIEYARMLVGTKAIATLSTGYLNALDYAKTRIQGPDLLKMTDKASPRVSIIHHADVRRILMMQKSYAEGMRALIAYTATWQDRVELARAGIEGADGTLAARVNDLLLPIVKGVGSERSYEMLALSLQTFGGSGYLQDYPIEQYVRDAKIDTLYEGTTAIQGQDFFFRKIVKDQFVALMTVAGEITETVKGDEGSGQLSAERELLGRALEDVQAMIGVMGQWAMASQAGQPNELYKVGLNGTRLLMTCGDLIIGWLLLRQAEIAHAKVGSATGRDKAFYEGKVAAARWFAENRLPLIKSERKVAEATDLAIMELPEDAF